MHIGNGVSRIYDRHPICVLTGKICRPKSYGAPNIAQTGPFIVYKQRGHDRELGLAHI